MSTLAMPKIDQSVLNDKESIVRDLKKFTNSINIISATASFTFFFDINCQRATHLFAPIPASTTTQTVSTVQSMLEPD